MREFVNICCICGKDIYCEDGFYNGIILENGKTICFSCEKKEKNALRNL